MATNDQLIFAVNGNIIVVKDPDPEVTILHYLRYKLRLRGTKLGCGEGGCGACTVMLSKYDFGLKRVKHFTVYACITSICKINLMNVITIEGVGDMSNMHPIQKRIAEYNGTQCGFCTPGIVMSMYTLLRNNPEPTEREIEDAFDGNLCRCTGYSSILSGCKTFACGAGDECCQVKKNGDLDKPKEDVVIPKIESTLDPTQEIIFPPQFMKKVEKSLKFCGKRVNWYIPSNLQELIELKKGLPKAKLLSGGTLVTQEGVSDYICIYQISVLNEMVPNERGLHVGAAVTITDLDLQMKQLIKEKPKSETQVLASIVEFLPHMASNQVRNVGSVIGNLCVSSFAADLHNILLAAHVQILILNSENHERIEIIDQKFFEKDGGIKPGEIIVSFLFPWTNEGELFKCYKQGRRRTCDLAIANSAFFVRIKDTTIEDCRLVFGGLDPTTLLASQTSNVLKGLQWNEDIVNIGLDSLSQEFDVSPDHPEGMHEYRETLACSFYLKFCLYVTQTLWGSLPPDKISGIGGVTLPLTKSTECFDKVPDEQPKDDPVGRPIVKESAYAQVTGTAKYVDDHLMMEGELYAAAVVSQKVHAKILSVEVEEALAVEGVVAYISHADIPEGGSNETGMGNEEELFAKSEVKYYGELIGLVIAEDRMLAFRGAELVKVRYEELPVLVTIEDAIAANSFYDYDRKIKRGNPESEFSKCDKTLTRELKIGGQEHFYFETQSCIVAPTGEDNCIRVISSSQSLQYVKSYIGRALGIMRNKIICCIKRLGGAFGGKNSRSCTLAAATAVAVHKLNRPIRIMLDRKVDMKYSGGRHPFLAKYKVGFQNDGFIKALSMELYSNAGYSIDFSKSVMTVALYKIDNAYYIPNFSVTPRICKTNLASNTAFRGYGGPQVIWIMENVFNDIALSLNRSIAEIQKQNFYVDGQTTPYGMELENCTITACWNELLKVSNYTQRDSEKDEFNKKNLYKKRGIGIVPVKFGIGYDNNTENQGGALVHILKDGSVMLYHGGIESGQGLNTKVMQICSRALGVPISKIQINDTSTNTIANPSGTGSSVSTDIYGQATVNACNILNDRLATIRNANPPPSGTWEQWIKTAYKIPIDLTAKGFYHSDIKGMDWSGPDHIGKGTPVSYFTYGCACSLVEVDVLTGDFKVLETDIVMDVGRSINPVIDIGQIEGAFVQGMGLYTLEELLYLNESADTQQGTLSTTSPLTYKIPAFTDAPANLKVHLLHDSTNPKGLYGSKGIGEPALLLGSSVFFGIRDAILASTEDSKGNIENFVFNSPATAERIRMNCKDSITERVTCKGKQPKRKLFVAP